MAKSPKKAVAKNKTNSSANDRMLIEAQTAAFLKSGGKIMQIPTGTSGVNSGTGPSQTNKKTPKAAT